METERNQSLQVFFSFFFESKLTYEQTNKKLSLSTSHMNTNRFLRDVNMQQADGNNKHMITAAKRGCKKVIERWHC